MQFLGVEHRHLPVLRVEFVSIAGQRRGKALGVGAGLFDSLSCAESRRQQLALTRRFELAAFDIGFGRGDGAFGLGHLGVLQRLAGLEIFDRRLGPEKVCLGLRDPRLIVGLFDFDQQVAGLDAVEIIDRDAGHIAFDLGAQRGDVAANIGVIGDLPDADADPAVPLRREQDDDGAGGSEDGEPESDLARPAEASTGRGFGRLLRHRSR